MPGIIAGTAVFAGVWVTPPCHPPTRARPLRCQSCGNTENGFDPTSSFSGRDRPPTDSGAGSVSGGRCQDLSSPLRVWTPDTLTRSPVKVVDAFATVAAACGNPESGFDPHHPRGWDQARMEGPS
jgi:hypothetical protein